MKLWGAYRSEGILRDTEPAVRQLRVVTAAIIVIRVMALCIGTFAPNLEIQQPDNTLKVPLGAICAPFFAALATIFVAFWGYRDR